MKRQGYIFEKFEDIEFIKEAIKSAAKHKTKRSAVRKTLNNLDEKARLLQEMILNETYKPSELRITKRWDARSKKIRTISSPKFYPDQCIHWAVIMAIKPVLMRGMYRHSYGNIPGRGRTKGTIFMQKILRNHARGTKWCLKMDIRHFYQSINKETLLTMLQKKIKDEQMLSLLQTIIYSYKDGLPLGNYTSQWLANFYLQELDHKIKEQMKARFHIRYVDDMVIIGNNKKKLHRMRNEIETYLKTISLELKKNHQVFKVDDRGIDFLGYVFFHGYTKLRDRNFLSLRRSCARFRRSREPTSKLCQMILAKIAQLKYCNSRTIYEKYIERKWIEKAKEVIRNENRRSKNIRRTAAA